MNKSFLTRFLLSISLGCVFSGTAKTDSTEFRNSFKEVSSKMDEGTRLVKYIDTKNNELILKINSNVPSLKQDQYFNVVLNYLRALYQDSAEPYSGKTEKPQACQLIEETKKPLIRKDGIVSSVMNLFSDHNKSIGFCQQFEDGYNVRVLLVYCEKPKIFINGKYFYKAGTALTDLTPQQLCDREAR